MNRGGSDKDVEVFDELTLAAEMGANLGIRAYRAVGSLPDGRGRAQR